MKDQNKKLRNLHASHALKEIMDYGVSRYGTVFFFLEKNFRFSNRNIETPLVNRGECVNRVCRNYGVVHSGTR